MVLELQYSQLPYIQRESRLCRYLEQYRVRSLLFEQRLQPLAPRGHGSNILRRARLYSLEDLLRVSSQRLHAQLHSSRTDIHDREKQERTSIFGTSSSWALILATRDIRAARACDTVPNSRSASCQIKLLTVDAPCLLPPRDTLAVQTTSPHTSEEREQDYLRTQDDVQGG